MNDIGFVQYTKNLNQGMDAKWHYWINGALKCGTGMVEGTLGETFIGDFLVTYFDQHGTETSRYQLHIYLQEDQYMVEWLTNAVVEYTGTGIVHDNKLFVGWRSVTH